MQVAAPRSRLDRVLSLVGDDAPETLHGKTAAFRRFLLMAVAVEAVESWHYWATQPDSGFHLSRILLLVIVCATGWAERWARPAVLGALALMLLELYAAFPRNANHHYLQTLLLGLFALLATDRPAERRLLLQSVRWIAVIGLLWAGIQKLLHGYYFKGAFLAYAIAETSRFAGFFRYLVPDAEVARLQALEFGENAGPYLVDSAAFIVASNLAYLGELIPAVLLLVPRTRTAAVWALVVYVVLIEMGARELFFGALILNMLLLFTERNWNGRLLPLFAAAYLYLLAMSLGLLPRWYFT